MIKIQNPPNRYKAKKIFVKWGFRIFLFFCLQQTFAQQTLNNVQGRKTLSLDGNWQIIQDWYDRGVSNGIPFDNVKTNASGFNEYAFSERSLKVPGDWNSQSPELKYYEGSIWYKKIFNYKNTGQRSFLYFEGVNYIADAYLNGQKIGTHEGGFTPFQFEITNSAKKGNNELLVRVNNQRIKDGIPALKFDWWNYGGITRSVYLVNTPKNNITDYFIQLQNSSNNEVKGWVQSSDSIAGQPLTILIPEIARKLNCQTDINGKATFNFTASLQLWTPENPRLYQVVICSATDTVKEMIGFRTLEVKGNQILLNKKSIFLKGISFHEENPITESRAYSKKDMKQLLSWAKELGCNFIRLAHYPQNEYLVRLAEEMGFMMWEEIPVWQGIEFGNPIIVNKADKMLKEMVSRDKNRCGIIIWSLSNETVSSLQRNTVLSRMVDSCRALDPTRLISSAFDHFEYQKNKITITDSLIKKLDLIAVNKYMGWYTPWPTAPGDVIWQSNFNKPLLISEFGGEALYGKHGFKTDKNEWNEEYQEQLYKDNITMFEKIPSLAGICPWVLVDFKSPYRMNLKYQNGWNRKGLLSDKGEKKKSWYIIKSFYEHKDSN